MAKRMHVVSHDGADGEKKLGYENSIISAIRSKKKTRNQYLPIMQRYRHAEVKLPSDDGSTKTYSTLEMNGDVGNGLVEMLNVTTRWLEINVPIKCVA